MNEVLRCEALVKSYLTGERTIEVLKGVDLQLEEGKMVAVVGESGVGKSTLLHMLGAIDRPDSGKVYLRGIDLFARNGNELAQIRNREVGFVFQFHHLLPEFTALENVMMPFLIGGTPRGKAEEPAAEVLSELGMGDRLDHRPHQLSGGEQQRVAIARAIAMRPSLILADEPTGNLDPRTGQLVFEQIQKVQKSHSFTVVVATHNENLARRCDRIFRIVDGTLKELSDAEIKKYFEI
ncbi:MAG: ABC transporter ATP-binding protein [Acidobacteriota bacterium]